MYLMDDLLAEFVAETRENLEAIGGEIVAWEVDPSDASRIDAIFRFVHTVKGNCGFFDLPRLEKLSHATEGTLAEVRAGRRQADAGLVSAVLAVIDRITDMIDSIDAGGDVPEGDDESLIAALEPAGDVIDLPIPKPSGSAGHKASPANNAARSIRLPVELLDRVMSGVSDLVLARNDLARRLREAGSQAEIDGPFERLSATLEDVRDGVTRIRMQRIEYLFGTLPRLVRDLSSELGKQVMLDIEGGNVELDREMIEMIRDPLIHIIRNAVDHGIETPSRRIAAGKREIGLLHIAARQAGNKIVIMIRDDGRGIDDDKLVEKAVAAGLIGKEEAADIPLDKRYKLMFEPGLSTAEEVTSISGRGVGMDVVHANIKRIGGDIEIVSTRGEGASIYLRLPLTLSIIPSLTVGVGAQKFALARGYIEEIVDAGLEKLQFDIAGDQLLVNLKSQRVPCVPVGKALGIAALRDVQQSLLVLVKLASGAAMALAVDRIHDHEDLVIKPLAPPVMATGLYSGTTLLDDGSPMLMLDLAGLAQRSNIALERQGLAARMAEGEAVPVRKARAIPVLQFIGLDGRPAAIAMGVVDRIDSVSRQAIDIRPSGAKVVIDGTLYPLCGLEAGALTEGDVNLLRLNDGQSELAYAIGRIIDTSMIEGEITTSQSNGEFDSVTFINGEVVELVDCHRLFAGHARPLEKAEAPLCRLPDGDAWTDTILRPLVEAAGYRVLGGSDETEADVAIALCDQETAMLDSQSQFAQGRQLIRLRNHPEDGDAAMGSIYRYDRAGLVAALTAARMRRTA